MAKLVVVAVHDSAVQAFNRPFYVPSVGVAMRSFSDEVNRKAEGNTMNEHPSDFTLHMLGVFDEDSGIFDQSEVRVLTRAVDVVRKD